MEKKEVLDFLDRFRSLCTKEFGLREGNYNLGTFSRAIVSDFFKGHSDEQIMKTLKEWV